MINPTLMLEWLEGQLVDVLAQEGMPDWGGWYLGPDLPDLEFPETLGIYTPTAGAGEEAEGIVQLPGFQLRIRGIYEQTAQLLTLADAIDRALMFTAAGALWGTQIISVERTGGMFAPLVDDPRNKRVSVVCTYIVRDVIQVGS